MGKWFIALPYMTNFGRIVLKRVYGDWWKVVAYRKRKETRYYGCIKTDTKNIETSDPTIRRLIHTWWEKSVRYKGTRPQFKPMPLPYHEDKEYYVYKNINGNIKPIGYGKLWIRGCKGYPMLCVIFSNSWTIRAACRLNKFDMDFIMMPRDPTLKTMNRKDIDTYIRTMKNIEITEYIPHRHYQVSREDEGLGGELQEAKEDGTCWEKLTELAEDGDIEAIRELAEWGDEDAKEYLKENYPEEHEDEYKDEYGDEDEDEDY